MRIRQGEGARARAREARDAGTRRARATACRRSSPAASSSASRWRARWCSSRRCCCSTSRCRTSTRSCAAACGRRSASCSSRSSLTVIYVTHDQEEALAVSDHIIVMDSGRIAQQGTPHELYETPASRFLADFIGDANLVDGELAAGAGGPTFTAGGAAACRCARTASRRVPPRSRCGRTGCASSTPGPGSVPGVCKRAAYLGSRIEYVVATPWGELLVFDDEARAAARRATSRSAWRSTPTPRSCCGADSRKRGGGRRVQQHRERRRPRRSRSGSPASSPGSPRRPTRSR